MLTENEIRPKDLFDQYLKLSEADGKKLNHAQFSKISCPACLQDSGKSLFTKYGFSFEKCTNCSTLFCNPRPTPNQLREFYVNSKSAEFWSKEFLPVVESARREKLVKPKVKDILEHLAGLNFVPAKICDVGASHGFVLEELKHTLKNSSFYAIEPDDHSCNLLRGKGIQVIQGLLGENDSLAGQMNFVTCFEVFEHVYSPLDFANEIYKLLAPGGLALITTLNCEGFDILTLQENSKSISPPHHLNFFSLKGFKTLFGKAGFKEVLVETPGKLDVDIVLNSGHQNEFLEVLKTRGPEAIAEFQQFLAKNKLSSHTWIWVRK